MLFKNFPVCTALTTTLWCISDPVLCLVELKWTEYMQNGAENSIYHNEQKHIHISVDETTPDVRRLTRWRHWRLSPRRRWRPASQWWTQASTSTCSSQAMQSTDQSSHQSTPCITRRNIMLSIKKKHLDTQTHSRLLCNSLTLHVVHKLAWVCLMGKRLGLFMDLNANSN